MIDPRMVQVAMRLQLLGVSKAGVQELLGYPLDDVERQLNYLPYRKAKRPEAFIIEAVRNSYSPPKELFYAAPQTPLVPQLDRLDQNPQLPAGPPDANLARYGASSPPGFDTLHPGMESGGAASDPLLSDLDPADW